MNTHYASWGAHRGSLDCQTPKASLLAYWGDDGCSSTMPAIKNSFLEFIPGSPGSPGFSRSCPSTPPRDFPSTRARGQDGVSSKQTPSKHLLNSISSELRGQASQAVEFTRKPFFIHGSCMRHTRGEGGSGTRKYNTGGLPETNPEPLGINITMKTMKKQDFETSGKHLVVLSFLKTKPARGRRRQVPSLWAPTNVGSLLVKNKL